MNESLERRKTINFVLSAIVSARWLHCRFISELLQLIEYEAEPLIIFLCLDLSHKAQIPPGPALMVPRNFKLVDPLCVSTRKIIIQTKLPKE